MNIVKFTKVVIYYFFTLAVLLGSGYITYFAFFKTDGFINWYYQAASTSTFMFDWGIEDLGLFLIPILLFWGPVFFTISVISFFKKLKPFHHSKSIIRLSVKMYFFNLMAGALLSFLYTVITGGTFGYLPILGLPIILSGIAILLIVPFILISIVLILEQESSDFNRSETING